MNVSPSGIATTSTRTSYERSSQAANTSSAQTSQPSALAPNPSAVAREPTSAASYHMTTAPKSAKTIVAELLEKKGLRASRAVQDWLVSQYNARPINIDNLLCVDGKLTRYGKINIEGRQFIVGPRPKGEEVSAKQGHIYQRLINAYPNIGAIFSVDPNLDNTESKKSSYISMAEYVRPSDNDDIERHTPLSAKASPNMPQSVSYKEFHGFNERSKQTIPQEAFWVAGREIAQFMKTHPEQIAMICSEQGLSRPCAVAASAVMQLEERTFAQFKPGSAAWEKKYETLKETLKTQRCAQSDTHIEASKKAFSANLLCVGLLDEMRTAGSWDSQIGDIVPHILPQTSLLDGRGLILQNADGHFMHRYALDANGNANEQHDGNITPQDNDIILYHLIDDRLGNHYEIGNAQGQAWNGETVIAADGDCLFRALHRALSTNANSNINEAEEAEAILSYREIVADYLADNMDVLTPFIATQRQQVWTSENLGEDIKLEDIQVPPQSEYRSLDILHTDQITLEDIDATAPTSIRLVMRDPDSNALTTDNKYFNNASIANYHKEQLNNQGINQMKNLTSASSVVGFIDHQNAVHDIELLLGTADYTITPPLADGQRRHDHTYRLPILSVAHREISHITDKNGCVIGGAADGKTALIDNNTQEPARNAVFFRAKLATKNLADKAKPKSLVCYTDPHTFEYKMQYVDASAIHQAHRNHNHSQYNAAFKNPEQLDTTIREQYPPLPAKQSQRGIMAAEERMMDPLAQQRAAQRRHATQRTHHASLATPQHSGTAPIASATTYAVETNARATQRRDDSDTDLGRPGTSGAARGTRVPNLFQRMRAYVNSKVHHQQNQDNDHTGTQHSAQPSAMMARYSAQKTAVSFAPNNPLMHQNISLQPSSSAIAQHKQPAFVHNKNYMRQDQGLQIDPLASTSTTPTSTSANNAAENKQELSIDMLRQKQADLTRKKEILLQEKTEIEAKMAPQALIAPALREVVAPKSTNEKKILPEKTVPQKALAN